MPNRLRSAVEPGREGTPRGKKTLHGGRQDSSQHTQRSSGREGAGTKAGKAQRPTRNVKTSGRVKGLSSLRQNADSPRGAAVPKNMRGMDPARSRTRLTASKEKQADAIRTGRASANARNEGASAKNFRGAGTSTTRVTSLKRGQGSVANTTESHGALPRSIREQRGRTKRGGFQAFVLQKKFIVTGVVVLVALVLFFGIYSVLTKALMKMDESNSAPSPEANFDPVKCTSEMLQISMEREGGRTGQPVNFTIKVKNDRGDRPCFVDVGKKQAGIKIWSGDQQVWDSRACGVGEASKVLLLDKNLESSHIITWDGNVYGANCVKQYPAKTGSYQAQFMIGDSPFGNKLGFALDPSGKNAKVAEQQTAPHPNEKTVQPAPDPSVKSDVDGNGSAVDKADPNIYKSDAPSDVTAP
ncbi:hypothetical protein [Arcanobacterium ihumii]|uniref:hypothetical protein n=1 Tax=Arcanobacterium ihumii TaxID=2138162 RepID=UPI000F530326|nr:hypothetical protein [Arcanobacterium ihumii]